MNELDLWEFKIVENRVSFLAENQDILDKTYESVVQSRSKSNNKLDKIVKCLESDQLVFDDAPGKENVDLNVNGGKLGERNAEARVSSVKIDEEHVSDSEMQHCYFSKTPKDDILRIVKDLDMPESVQDQIMSGIEGYFNDSSFLLDSSKKVFNSFSFPPYKKSNLQFPN